MRDRVRDRRANFDGMRWSAAEVKRLHELAPLYPTKEIAGMISAEFGIPRSKSAVIGKMHQERARTSLSRRKPFVLLSTSEITFKPVRMLFEEMNRQRCSESELARRVGITAQTIGRWRRSSPKLFDLENCFQALGLKLDYRVVSSDPSNS